MFMQETYFERGSWSLRNGHTECSRILLCFILLILLRRVRYSGFVIVGVSDSLTWSSNILEILLDVLIERVQRLELSILLEEHPPLNEPWKPGTSLVFGELSERYGKDIVEFFQCSLLGFWHEEEDHNEGYDVQSGVETKSTCGCESC